MRKCVSISSLDSSCFMTFSAKRNAASDGNGYHGMSRGGKRYVGVSVCSRACENGTVMDDFFDLGWYSAMYCMRLSSSSADAVIGSIGARQDRGDKDRSVHLIR